MPLLTSPGDSELEPSHRTVTCPENRLALQERSRTGELSVGKSSNNITVVVTLPSGDDATLPDFGQVQDAGNDVGNMLVLEADGDKISNNIEARLFGFRVVMHSVAEVSLGTHSRDAAATGLEAFMAHAPGLKVRPGEMQSRC